MLNIYDAICSRFGEQYCFSWKLEGDSSQADYQILIRDFQGKIVWGQRCESKRLSS